MPNVCLVILLGAAAAANVSAQPEASEPSQFEAASVRLTPPPSDGRYSIGAQIETARFVADYMTLQDLIQAVYPYQSGQKIVGPAWINAGDTRYCITAKASGPVSKKQMRVLIQHLLEQRFQLKIHPQDRPAPIYALVTEAKGIKLQPVAFDGPDPNAGAIHYEPNGAEFKHATMALLAGFLGVLGRPVVDETGVSGVFDFKLTYATRASTPILDPPADSDQPSIFTALQSIGLKLENRQGSITDYIIDHVERVPTEN